jgi:hypothetical protein
MSPLQRLIALAAFAAPLAATGCGRLQREFDWVAANPTAPQAVKRAVMGHRLLANIGMTEDAVRASWGEPHEVRSLGGRDARWIYRRPQEVSGRKVTVEYLLVFKRGQLISVHQQRYR